MPNYTQGLCYLVELQEPFERLEFQFLPTEIQIQRNTKISELEVIGRNNPLFHYTSGSTSIPLKLEFYAEDDRQQEVMQKAKWLESLGYTDGYEQPPSKVKLVFGDMFRDEVWVVKNPNTKYSNFNPNMRYLPLKAEVSLTLLLDTPQNLKREDIRWTS